MAAVKQSRKFQDNPAAKVANCQYAEIQRRYAAGESMKRIAAHYRVHISTAYKILKKTV